MRRPGLAKFLFNCEFYLLDEIAKPGRGVWFPTPQHKYVCNGDLPGMVRIDLAQNDVGWNAAYHDIAFIIKVLHDVKAVEDETPFFDFHVNYTPELGEREYETMAYGS